MIIVEGYDGSGKTTAAEKLAERFSLTLFHAGGPPNTTLDVMSCMARAQARMAQKVVQDRVTHVSESVYGMLCRPRHCALALSRIPDLRFARVLLYCRPPDEQILENLVDHRMKGHDDPDHVAFVKAKARDLIRVYDTVIEMARQHVCVLVYDYTKVDDSFLFTSVGRMIA